MWKPSSFSSLLVDSSLLLQGGRCLNCQFRGATATTAALRSRQSPSLRRYASNSTGEKPAQKSESKDGENSPATPEDKKRDFTPRVLDRPLGLVYPPEEGQNTGIDTRTLRQRRDDFVDYEKHLQRRKELTRQVAKPYFREWTNMQYHQGKTFIAPPRLFKRDKALYFPNLYGITLASPKEAKNTTPLLRGRVSVVNLFSSVWAEQQVATFTGPKQNPGLYEVLKSAGPLAQRVDINVEDNTMKAWLVRMFMWSMRRKLPKEQHERYFLVRKGLTDGLKEAIGMMNSKVGYIYLLDDSCRIRWAGSGPAEEAEMEALNNNLRRLVEEKRTRVECEIPAAQWESTKQKDAASLRPRVVVR
ncbi:hypothetical protein VTN00DRAFT_4320 [Thermoascus crustaceus]|uniref:uncharacterized protein n=1 Tax=Thermoascus crustaceus TaxID=5088 RepID=UPI003743520D